AFPPGTAADDDELARLARPGHPGRLDDHPVQLGRDLLVADHSEHASPTFRLGSRPAPVCRGVHAGKRQDPVRRELAGALVGASNSRGPTHCHYKVPFGSQAALFPGLVLSIREGSRLAPDSNGPWKKSAGHMEWLFSFALKPETGETCASESPIPESPG